MNKLILQSCLFCLSILWAGIVSQAIFADSLVGEIEFTNCKVTDPSGKFNVSAECATLSVPENYAEPDGTKIELHIARLKAKNEKARDDAMTLLAGGPGQAAIETFAPYIGRFKDINRSQDIFLVDQRGTGKSNQMQCDIDVEEDTGTFDPEIVKSFIKDCLENLPGDARFYTTSVAMKDLDVVREKLGVKQWNLYGGSYGTRTAQHYLKQYPQHVRSVILDAVVPADLPLGPEIALQSQRALDAMLSRCAADKDCNNAFPGLAIEVQKLIDNLKEEPRTVSIENLASGKLESFNFTIAHLGIGIRMSLYSPFSLSILPTLLHEAAANDHYGPLARQSINLSRMMYSVMAIGMSNSVMCTEDAPYFDQLNINRSELANTYMGEEFLQSLEITCDLWPKGVMDEGFKALVESDKPVLLLSGTEDPITPPAYAEHAMQKMTNSKHIIVEGQGHIQMGTGCMPTILAKFVESASFDDIETECLGKIKPDPFFIDFNGPKP